MKNLQDFNVLELGAEELKIIDGGNKGKLLREAGKWLLYYSRDIYNDYKVSMQMYNFLT